MNGKILIVDYDLANRGYLRECLEREGHHVTTLSNGSNVTDFLAEGRANIFILNIDTPGVREKDLLFQIKKKGQSRVLLVVSERGDPFLKEAIDLGVYGFIFKPFNLKEVCTLVHHLTR
ncbi:MAG: response regulator [Deltaproteobacteria bacterium]